ncbi:MAG: hypothetical protein HONBIEJF_00969 [Fimbriimonadaceae bacterium]|nr:hypothetical protein [Fimbriimonadaceae bacterium]
MFIMKALVVLGLAAIGVSAQAITVYNQLGQQFDTADAAWDGGSNIFGSSFGCQVGQQMTVPNGATAITKVAVEMLVFNTNVTTALVSVHEVISGTPQTNAYSSATVSITAVFDRFDTMFGIDIHYVEAAGLNLALPAPGTDIVVQLQPQSSDWGYVLRSSVNPQWPSYSRDFSSFGYAGVYGHSNWASFMPGTSDVSMLVEAVPEPATMTALGLGIVAICRRRRVR